MPRSGGESGKFGDLYESLWVVDAILDVLSGDWDSLTYEGVGDEDTGLEFRLRRTDGSTQAHSVKRQHSSGHWTIGELTSRSPTGRTILGDLLRQTGDQTAAVFSSGVAPYELEELCRIARLTDNLQEFSAHIAAQGRLADHFENKVTPLVGAPDGAYSGLKHIYVRVMNQDELVRHVEQRIRAACARDDGGAIDALGLRLLLADFATKRLGADVTRAAVERELAERRVVVVGPNGDGSLNEPVRRITRLALRELSRVLINGANIKRSESQEAFDALCTGSSVLLDGGAGGGKSCVLSQVVNLLENADMPCVVVRLDTTDSGEVEPAAWGVRHGLRDSPVMALGQLAGTGPSVLCLDQLDTVSIVSGRAHAPWRFVEAILDEMRRFPSMRLLVACRSFDLELDPQLRSLVADSARFKRLPVGGLSPIQVQTALVEAGVGPSELTTGQLELLAIPLHLYLYLESREASDRNFGSRADLFERYWEAKSRSFQARGGVAAEWSAAIDCLTEALSRRQSLSAPFEILDDYPVTRRLLISEAVLVAADGDCRFFHESFFDYAFARSFLRADIDLVEWLAKDEQPLFRRSQVRQVLDLLRGRASERSRYERTLRSLLADSRVRFHIKQLVLDWLHQVEPPTLEEWKCVETNLDVLGDRGWGVPWGSAAWFDVLHEAGLWATWLRSDDDRVNRIVNLLSHPELFRARSADVATLIRPFRGTSPEWADRFRRMFSHNEAYHSPEMERLFLELIADGTMDDARPGVASNDDWWFTLYRAATAAPAFAARAIGAWFDRVVARAREAGQLDPFASDAKLVAHSQTSGHVISNASTSAPLEFAREMLPRLAALEVRSSRAYRGAPSWLGDPDDQIREALARALRRLATDSPDELDELLAGLDATPSQWIAATLLLAWSANPERYAERILKFLLAAPAERLDIGYTLVFAGTDSVAAVSRTALAAASPHFSDEDFKAVEVAIQEFTTPAERRLRWMGRTRLALLSALPPDRLSRRATRTLAELRRRFPEIKESGTPAPVTNTDSLVQSVVSPIPDHAVARMTDDQWLAAMRKYDYDWSRWNGEKSVGGAVELSRQLEAEARADPNRFTALALRFTSDLNSAYFDEVLRGLVPLNATTLDFGTEDLWRVVRHFKALKVAGIGRELARVVPVGAAGGDLPPDVLALLCSVATEDPDPEADTWDGGDSHNDAEFQAINSARGEAALSIARLIYTDRGRWTAVRDTVKQLAQDPVLAVRSVAVESLTAILDTDQLDALELFELLLQGADAILGERRIERFLGYAIHREPVRVRPLLDRILASDNPKAAGAAGRLSAAMGLWVEGYSDLIISVSDWSDAARAGATEVFAANVGDERAGELCLAQLALMFDDPSPEVRKAASRCWYDLQGTDPASVGALIVAFARSPALGDDAWEILHFLEEATGILPAETCALAEQAIESFGDRGSSIAYAEAAQADTLAKLLVRMHEQTDDAALRARILDCLDAMLLAGFYGVDREVKRGFDREGL